MSFAAERPFVLAVVLVCVWAALSFAMDPMKATIVMLAIGTVFLSLVVPMVGLWINLFANSSLQVLGSAHIIGAPTSLSKMFGMVSLAAIILHFLFANWKVTGSALYKALFLFAIPVLIWDFFPVSNEVGTMEGISRLSQMVLLVFLISTIAGQSRRALDLAVLGLFCAVALCGIIGAAEHFLPSFAIESDDPRVAAGTLGAVIDRESLDGVALKRISGGVGDANWLAYTIAITVPLLVYAWDRWKGLWVRSVFLFLAALQMIALVLSYTRTGFLGLGFAGLYLILRGVVPLRPLLAIVGVGAIGFMLALPEGFVDRMFSPSYLKEGSTPLRAFFVTEASNLFMQNPLVGTGFKSFGAQFYEGIQTRLPEDVRLEAWANDTIDSVESGRELVSNIGAHNLALELLVEYGLVGAVLYGLIFVVAWREATLLEQSGDRSLRIMGTVMKAAMIAFMFCGLLGHNKYLKIIWIMFGLLLAARRLAIVGDSGTDNLLKVGRRE